MKLGSALAHVPTSVLLRPVQALSDALVHYVPSSVLLALIASTLLVGWAHVQSSVLAGLGREARRFKNSLDITTVYTVSPVEYVFDRAGTKRDQLAWRGLQRNGPYDRTTFAKKSPRILVVYPDTIEGKVDIFLKALRDGVQPSRGFPNGFAKTFGLVNPEFLRCPVRLFGNGGQSVQVAYCRSSEEFLAKDPAIDASIVAIIDEHAQLPTLQNPYVRSKTFFLTLGIPTQEIRLAT
jgi:hypothetical protein